MENVEMDFFVTVDINVKNVQKKNVKIVIKIHKNALNVF